MSYIRLFLHTKNNETYHVYLGISALDKLGINLSALEKLENLEGQSKTGNNTPVRIFDNKNNELVTVGNPQEKPLPVWLQGWLEERGYQLPESGILKTISEKEFAEALNSTEIYYFGREPSAVTA
jgi:hypothetical protein